MTAASDGAWLPRSRAKTPPAKVCVGRLRLALASRVMAVGGRASTGMPLLCTKAAKSTQIVHDKR
jgi:hypothetical protein